MVAALPRNVRLKLDQTLSQWRHWRCDPPLPGAPEPVRALGNGISNYSVLVAADQRYVVRIDGVNAATLGLNRQTEWRILQAAAVAGIAPRPRYFNPELTSLVCDYLEPDECQEASTGQLAGLLRGIHRLPARHARLDLAERVLRYEKQLDHGGSALPSYLRRSHKQMRPILQNIAQRKAASVLCHNDLLRANRIRSGGQLWALDWEYSAMGSAWHDLAVVLAGDEMAAEQGAQLLRHYLGRQATAAEQLALQQHCCAYRYLELLWYLCQQRRPPTASADMLEAKAADLTLALAELAAANP